MRFQWRVHKFLWSLSNGRLGRRIVGMPVLELETIGHKSGMPRSILITYIDDPAGPVVFGTNAGLDRDPAWVRNLRATPNVRVRINGTWTQRTAHTITTPGERDRLWTAAVGANPGYAQYLKTLTREVPIIQLTSLSAETPTHLEKP